MYALVVFPTKVAVLTIYVVLFFSILYRFSIDRRERSLINLLGVVLNSGLLLLAPPPGFLFFIFQMAFIYSTGRYVRVTLNIPTTTVRKIGNGAALLLALSFGLKGLSPFRYLFLIKILLLCFFVFFQIFFLGPVSGRQSVRSYRLWTVCLVLLSLAGSYEILTQRLLLPAFYPLLWLSLIFSILLYFLFMRGDSILFPAAQRSFFERVNNSLLSTIYTRIVKSEDILLLQDKLMKVGVLSTGILHELKNIFFTMETASSYGLQQAESEAKDQCLLAIRECITRGQSFSEKILQRIKLEENQKERIDLKQEFSRLLKILRANFRTQQIEFICHSQPGLFLSASRVDLEQVLLNLIGNAVNALEHSPNSLKQVSLSAGNEQGRLFIDVRDTGPGISGEILECIFDPAISGENSTGMGLYIANLLVQRNGGCLECLPTGEGAHFRLVFTSDVGC